MVPEWPGGLGLPTRPWSLRALLSCCSGVWRGGRGWLVRVRVRAEHRGHRACPGGPAGCLVVPGLPCPASHLVRVRGAHLSCLSTELPRSCGLGEDIRPYLADGDTGSGRVCDLRGATRSCAGWALIPKEPRGLLRPTCTPRTAAGTKQTTMPPSANSPPRRQTHLWHLPPPLPPGADRAGLQPVFPVTWAHQEGLSHGLSWG